MWLIIHIVSSTIGISGAYLKAFSKKDSIKKLGLYLTLFGLTFVTISGIFLFQNDPQKFLDSGKFLSNMTVMFFLIVIEICDYLKKFPRVTKIASVFSWTWIFLVAIVHPSWDYWVFMLIYFVLFLFTINFGKIKKTEKELVI